MSDVTPRLKTALADRYCLARELGAGGVAWETTAEAAARPAVAEATAPRVGLPTDGRAASLLVDCRDD